jgi:hypothetical protein
MDAWLAQLRQRCDDPEWCKWYAAMHGQPQPPPVGLPPYPERGDDKGWQSWWRTWNDAYRAAGASADGIDDPPPPNKQAPRCFKLRRLIRRTVRREIKVAIPSVVAAVVEVVRGR